MGSISSSSEELDAETNQDPRDGEPLVLAVDDEPMNIFYFE